jgi:hypothetical protein
MQNSFNVCVLPHVCNSFKYPSAWEGSSSRRRKTLIPNLRCLAAISIHGTGFGSKPQENPELESLRQCSAFYSNALATPATALMPNCSSPVAPLDPLVTWRGGPATWAIACPPYTSALASILPLERTLQRATSVETTRGATVTGYKSRLDWHRARRQGCSRRWKRPSGFTGQLPPV